VRDTTSETISKLPVAVGNPDPREVLSKQTDQPRARRDCVLDHATRHLSRHDTTPEVGALRKAHMQRTVNGRA
jgi:hypothetical protein